VCLAKHMDNFNPLQHAMDQGYEHFSCFEQLLQYGFDVQNIRIGLTLITPTSYCIQKGNLECLRAVLESSHYHLNFENQDGETPIVQAIKRDRVEMVQLLVEAGADPNIRDIKLVNAVGWAIKLGQYESLKVIFGKIVEGTTPHLSLTRCLAFPQGGSADTALITAIEATRTGMVKFLLQCDADPLEPNGFGETPIEISVINGAIYQNDGRTQQPGIFRLLFQCPVRYHIKWPLDRIHHRERFSNSFTPMTYLSLPTTSYYLVKGGGLNINQVKRAKGYSMSTLVPTKPRTKPKSLKGAARRVIRKQWEKKSVNNYHLVTQLKNFPTGLKNYLVYYADLEEDENDDN